MNRKVLSIFLFGIFMFSLLLWVNASQASQLHSPDLPEIALGEPGLSFRYVEMFGNTNQPYISDTSHHNFPRGVGTDGTTIWIAELAGRRALKFASDGSYQGVQIGNAGYDTYQDQTIWRAVDVAVDSGGNVWIADSSARHVLKFDSNGDFLLELGEAWEWGSDNDHFGMPTSVAFDSNGNLYVSDGSETWTGGNQRIQIFDTNGVYTNTIGETGVAGSDNNHFREPAHITIDDTDQLYVADFNNHRVQIFDVSDPSSPSYVNTIGVTGVSGKDETHFNNPSGVAVDINYIYVSDESNNRIQIFNRSTLAYVDTIGTGWGGSGNDQFQQPTDVAVDSIGNVYVSDYYNQRVQQFNSSWNYLRTFGVTGVPYITNGYHYNGPSGLATSTDGQQYILEGWGQRLLKVDANGDPVWAIGEPGLNGDDNQHFAWGGDVGLDSSENVYVADKANHRIQIYDSTGTFLDTLGITGSSGISNNQFDNPFGIGIAPNDDIYIADTRNHRIQIFNSNRIYKATLGVPGVSGTDNSHFSSPEDVVVNSQGMIFVADSRNQRVQVFDTSRNYLKTLGETDVSGEDFDHFDNPVRLAVDHDDNLYVVDTYNSRVQVFDAEGKYLTTIGGRNGSDPGELDTPYGIGIDGMGNVFIANRGSSQTQLFANGVPDWKQVNINGFGERWNVGGAALEKFGPYLYAGATNWEQGGRIWRSTDGTNWTPASVHGLGPGFEEQNKAILDLGEFNSFLYASTGWSGYPPQIWRSPDGLTWSQVVGDGFGDTNISGINVFVEFNDQLYIAASNENDGVEIWRTSTGDPGSWSQVNSNGFGSGADNSAVFGLIVFNNYLYAGVTNRSVGTQIWRSQNGTQWDQVNTSGFGTSNNNETGGFASFNEHLYVGTRNDTSGGELWRSSNGTTWELVKGAGFGDSNNIKVESLYVHDSKLIAALNNSETGLEIWLSQDGMNWDQINHDGFGDSNNDWAKWNNSTVIFNGSYIVGVRNFANGTELWRYEPHEIIYLPAVLR